MASLFNKRLSPFDVPGDEKKESLFDEISERDSGRTVYLTSQAAPYLICSVLSVASVLSCSTDYLMSGLYYLVLIVLWSITFRFFERQKLIPLSLILNAGPVVALSFIPGAHYASCPLLVVAVAAWITPDLRMKRVFEEARKLKDQTGNQEK